LSFLFLPCRRVLVRVNTAFFEERFPAKKAAYNYPFL